MHVARKDQAQGPVSSAGLVRYFDVSGGGIEIKPETVVIISVAFIAIVAVLNYLL